MREFKTRPAVHVYPRLPFAFSPASCAQLTNTYLSVILRRFVHFVRLHFVEKDIPTSIAPGQSLGHRETRLTLSRIAVYPIKSCGGFYVDEWEVGPHCLKYVSPHF